MKVLYVSQYFPPEMGAPSARVHELSKYWVRLGHEVTVLTGFPNHPTGEVPTEYKKKMKKLVISEEVDGIKVIRTWLYPIPNRKAYERILNYGSFFISAAIAGSFIKKPDVIIATSPPLLVGLSGYWVSLIKGVPFVFEVRDLWPESVAATEMLKRDSISIRLLDNIASFLYRKCNKIAVVTEAIRDNLIRNRGIQSHKIMVVENGVETNLFSPYFHRNVIKGQLGLERKFIVSYIGTIGVSHALEVVLEVAKVLKNKIENLIFLIVGEGAEKERLIRIKEEQKLSNVVFFDKQPKERVPLFINASDVCLVLLKKTEIFKTVLPSKMLEFMSCGRPIILGVDGQAKKILEEANCGIYVEPENIEALSRLICRFYENSLLRKELGDNGRDYILKRFSREKKASEYLNLLEDLVQNG
ncbi:MAG: glycosyltransferase WbuB [Candidatus Dadabacteria bacterium]